MGLLASLDSYSNLLVPWHALSAVIPSENGLTQALQAALTSALLRLASPTLVPRCSAETFSSCTLHTRSDFRVHLPAGPQARSLSGPKLFLSGVDGKNTITDDPEAEGTAVSVYTVNAVVDIQYRVRKSNRKRNPVFVICSHFVIACYLI